MTLQSNKRPSLFREILRPLHLCTKHISEPNAFVVPDETIPFTLEIIPRTIRHAHVRIYIRRFRMHELKRQAGLG